MSEVPPSPSRVEGGALRSLAAARTVAGPLAVVLAAGTAAASVSRYDLRIVVVYTVLAVALVASVAAELRATRVRVSVCDRGAARGAASVLFAAGATTWVAPTFTYLSAGQARHVKLALAGAAVVAGVVLLSGRRASPLVAMGVAVAGHVSAAALLIHHDPAPRIDVWVMLQQAADGLAHGENMYRQAWSGSPGVQDAFTYLPWMGALVAPGRWLAGDVRWALLVLTLAAALVPWAVGMRASRPAGDEGRGVGVRSTTTCLAALVLLLPGTSTQVEQAWTEPVLLACLASWYVAAIRGRHTTAIAALAVGLACKQHVWPLLAVIAAWRRFGVRRAAIAALGAGVLMAPWAATAPQAMWHDTVTLLIEFRALLFADTLYIAAIHELGWTPPFALTALVLGVTLLGTMTAVRRRRPAPGVVLRVLATVLLIANLVNKQAFYNQYWLVMTLLLVSWMPLPTADPADPAQGEVTEPERRPADAPA